MPCCCLQVAGAATFQAAPVEDYRLHVHVLQAQGASAPTHVLLWRPVPVGDVEAAEDAVEMDGFDVGFVAPGAAAAWRLTGAGPEGRVAAALPVITGSVWKMVVSSVPTIVVLATS